MQPVMRPAKTPCSPCCPHREQSTGFGRTRASARARGLPTPAPPRRSGTTQWRMSFRRAENLERPGCLQMLAWQALTEPVLLKRKGVRWRGRRGSNFMPILAYNGCGAGKAGTTAEVGLAGRLAGSADELFARSPTEARFRPVPGADRAEARKREDVARSCGNGLAGARGRSGRDVSCGVRGATRGRGLRASCFPEEGNVWNRDSATGIGSNPATAPNCA